MSRRLRPARSEFEAIAAHSTASFAQAFTPLLRAIVGGSHSEIEQARKRVAALIAETMTLADLYGRRRALLEFDAAVSKLAPDDAQFAATPVVPNVPFSVAYANLLLRTPRLAESASAVAELYQTTHSFALAKSAEMALTKAVQGYTAQAMTTGIATGTATQTIQALGDFTRSYAQTVYRTNLGTAYTAGRFQQAQEPGVRDVLPALERWSVRDSGVRQGREQDGGENHLAAHGLVAATTDPIWQTLAPPSGYNCRCGVRLVPLPELRRRGLMSGTTVLRYEPPGFGAFRTHKNFGKRRPDLLIYGGGRLT